MRHTFLRYWDRDRKLEIESQKLGSRTEENKSGYEKIGRPEGEELRDENTQKGQKYRYP